MKEISENPEQTIERTESNNEQTERNREKALKEIDTDLAPNSEKKEAVESKMQRNAEADLNNEALFEENPPGEYTYSETELGKVPVDN